HNMKGIQFVFVLYLHYALATDVQDPLIVRLPSGKLRGQDNGHYYSFESIPYAEPPLGELRFEAPQLNKRMWTETFDATKPPVPCLQWNQLVAKADKLDGNEDCLTVSVYKPKSESQQRFPVIAHIHGGAFMYGGVYQHGHSLLMNSGNVILVKINYRLGPLGFLSAEDSVLPGNFGLKDQRLALQWIKHNIASFGGDPENILLSGLSAGGASVHLQLLHKDFAHLARAAFSLSGTALNPWVVQKGAKQRAYEMGRILNCGYDISSLELKRCLQSKPAAEVVSAVQQFLVFGYVPFSPFSPVIEPADAAQAFLTQHPLQTIKSGQFAQVPWLASYTSEDGGFNAGILLEKQADGKELIEVLNARWLDLAPHLLFFRHSAETVEQMDNYSRKLRQQYIGNRNFTIDSYWDVQRLFTDVLFKNGTELALKLHAKHGKSPVYGYIYDNPATRGVASLLANRTDIHFGTVHGEDNFLIYDIDQKIRPLRPDEKIISGHFIKMIEDFVRAPNADLAYSSCQFTNNQAQQDLQMIYITAKGCHNKLIEP
ncbi:Est-6, partial [Drosophila busckii]